MAGNAQATCQGTVHWQIEDDGRVQHTLKIKGCYYINSFTTRILSPQHFAQSSSDHNPLPEGIGAITLSRNITRFCHQCCFTKTILLDPKTNIRLRNKQIQSLLSRHPDPRRAQSVQGALHPTR